MVTKINDKICQASVNKINLLSKSIRQFLLSAIFAGIFIGIGVIITFTIGSNLTYKTPSCSLIMGLSFSVALCYVIFTGTELFTGNNAVMSLGYLNKKINLKLLLSVWLISYIGNLIGSIIISYAYFSSELMNNPKIIDFFINISTSKSSVNFLALLYRGILCNVLVCLAVFMSSICKNETAKILLVVMCIFPFVTSGFEHSIANMTVYSIAMMHPAIDCTLSQAVSNIIPVTIGNIIGGAFVIGAGFYFMSKQNK